MGSVLSQRVSSLPSARCSWSPLPKPLGRSSSRKSLKGRTVTVISAGGLTEEPRILLSLGQESRRGQLGGRQALQRLRGHARRAQHSDPRNQLARRRFFFERRKR